jgi:hypothetical protein
LLNATKCRLQATVDVPHVSVPAVQHRLWQQQHNTHQSAIGDHLSSMEVSKPIKKLTEIREIRTGGIQPHFGSALYRAVAFNRSVTNGRHPFRALRLRYQQFDPTRKPVMGFNGLGEALMSIAPAKMLMAWSRRSFRKVSSRPRKEHQSHSVMVS